MKQQLLDALPAALYLRFKHWDYRLGHQARYRELQRMRTVTTEQGYSYKPFDECKAIFVHIPKCAGVAVNRALFGNLAGGHTTLDEYLNIFEPACIDRYFKFTIVRNPWDRLVSAFFFLRSGGMDQKDHAGFVKEFGHLDDFKCFVKDWVNRDNIWRWHQFRPQYHYMLEKRGKVKLDFVAFLENIDKDFSRISQSMGLTCSLPRANSSEHRSYMDYYDAETADIVASVYADDIRMLGYNFDNSSLHTQLAQRDKGKIYALDT
jgi:hypothetical protein